MANAREQKARIEEATKEKHDEEVREAALESIQKKKEQAKIQEEEESKQSASTLAHQLQNSINESEQPMINMVQSQSKQKYVKKAYGGGSVSSETTANLIANAIMHQKQKAMGIEETPAA